jgi:putative flippase GtrA
MIKGVFFQLIQEFSRYVLVGGIVFAIDFSVLYLTRTFLFPSLGVSVVILATACGLVANYILSSIFVFKKISESAKHRKLRSFIIFPLTFALLGLGLAAMLMYLGVRLAGEYRYLLLKCFTASVVLLWNYVSKKVFVFQRRMKW